MQLLLNDTEIPSSEIYLVSHSELELYNGNSLQVVLGNGSAALEDDDDCSNLELALFIACRSGDGGEYDLNLPARVVELGAKCAIGFNTDIDCYWANVWTQKFFYDLSQGSTFDEAAIFASMGMPVDSGVRYVDLTICGDSTRTFCLENGN